LERYPPIEYLHPFTRTADGFSSLVEPGKHETNVKAVAIAIADIAHLAAVAPIELHPSAVPGLLGAISVAAKLCSGVTDLEKMLLTFAEHVLSLIAVASQDEESKQLVAGHSAYSGMCAALEAVEDKVVANELLERLHAWKREPGCQ
jgi:hypothetical protein